MADLSGKFVLVTGGSRGIGAAISKRLAQEGATILIHYEKNQSAAEKTKAEIERLGGKVVLTQGDVSQPSTVKDLFRQIRARFGRLDILVNNAGISQQFPLSEIDVDRFDHLFEVNVRAAALTIGEASRIMRAGGRIINITSVAAHSTYVGSAAYSATKAALEAITRVASTELGPLGITVNAVAPGLIETDMTQGFFNRSPEEIKEVVEETPLRRIGQPVDIANVVAFLASAESEWITGQVIVASGGR